VRDRFPQTNRIWHLLIPTSRIGLKSPEIIAEFLQRSDTNTMLEQCTGQADRSLKSKLRHLVARIRWGDPDFFLDQVSGVVHVGANLGQERDIYAARGLNVIWLEPIPEVFGRLRILLENYPQQKAFCHLITNIDNQEYTFHISSNEGASSSIFDLAKHKELWPDVTFTKSIVVKSISLSSFVRQQQVDLAKYDALVMDTQGSELLVLQGAVDILPRFKFIKTEVADFESYNGCCKLSEMDDFLRLQGFRRVATARFTHKRGVGSYFDVVYASH
jgi:FkbM family methyltransferase